MLLRDGPAADLLRGQKYRIHSRIEDELNLG